MAVCLVFLPGRAEQLSETRAVRLLLVNNTRIVNAGIDIRIARTDKKIALTPFRPRVTCSVNRLFSDNSIQTAGDGTVSKLFSTGTAVSVSGGSIAVDSDFQDVRNRAGMVLVRQPLLRDGFGRASRRIIRSADIRISVARLESEILRQEMIITAVKLYWDFVTSLEIEKAQQERYRLYQELSLLIEKKKKEGGVEKREELITKSALLASRAALQRSVYSRARAQRNLVLFISPDRQFDVEPVLTADERVTEDAEKLMDRAYISSLIAVRPDIQLLQKNLEIITLQSEIDSSNSLPGLDLIAGYGSDSFSFNGAESGGFSYMPAENQESGYMAGISFSYAIGGNENSGRAQRDFLEALKVRNVLRTRQRQAVTEYVDSLELYKTALQRIELLKEVMDTDRENAENEKKELTRARSTFEQVVEYENRYISSRTAYWRGMADMRKAIAALRKSCGVLADRYEKENADAKRGADDDDFGLFE